MQGEYEYYSANSGLTPIKSYSFNDHYYAWLKLRTGRTTGTISDLESVLYVPNTRLWYASQLGSATNSMTVADIKSLFFQAGGNLAPATRYGNSGEAINGAVTNLVATWMARDSWQRVYNADYLYANTGYKQQIAANPTWNVALGVAFFPHDRPRSEWNGLLDSIINNTAVTIDSGSALPSAILASLGTKLVAQTPAQGVTYARMNWEMNISPGGADVVDTSKWKAAWNIAAPIIRSAFNAEAARVGNTNQRIFFDFSPISDGYDYTTYYPGDTNVDVITMDVYASKYGSTIPTATELTNWVAGFLTSIGNFAIAHNKPVGLGEWGNWQMGTAGQTTSHGRGDFPQYIDQVFDWAAAQQAANPKGVAYLSYYNINDSNNTGQNFADTPDSLARYQIRTGGTATPYPLKSTVAPALSGSATAGSVLTTSNGTWNYTPDSYTYRWQKNNVDISGATSSTYTTVTGDIGATIRCVVTATKAKYATASANSNSMSITAAGATNFVQDSFTDTAGTFLSSHTGETGATWTTHPTYNTGTLLITAGGTVRKGNANASAAYASGLPASADYTVEADLYAASIPASSSITINGRMDTTANTFYSMRYSSTSNGWFLTKTVGGTQTTLTSVLTPISVGQTVRMKLVMTGTTIEAWTDGTKVLTTTDSSITAAGRAGFQSVSTAGIDDSTGFQLDNFVAHP